MIIGRKSARHSKCTTDTLNLKAPIIKLQKNSPLHRITARASQSEQKHVISLVPRLSPSSAPCVLRLQTVVEGARQADEYVMPCFNCNLGVLDEIPLSTLKVRYNYM